MNVEGDGVRDIIFRGKRTSNGKWAEGSLLVYADGDCFICCEDVAPDVLNKYEVDPATVGQFSGVLDCKKVKIFEGDIVKFVKRITHFYERYYSEPEFYAIKFIDGMFAMDGNAGAFYSYAVDQENDEYVVEVAGNIHDNLELLQG